ncbi:hypothetical protein SENE111051_05895 [Serratia nematodiphila]|uniref:Uncharacterized protein n=1 Tax=Serratia nematodiphila TaxID=458197 RepID=A0A1G5I4V9_9GAMM|nr:MULTISPECIES: hypothetical protein [Serratia]ANM76157.1 hypothetical protein A4U88_2418 [Serratia marcescens]KFF86458.1 hypothetical protein JL05_24210 [Serratia nematodiphila DZ0503SBS1]MDT0207217.1 hypothetical protein [Serratia marcescens]CAI1677117.1 Uncharacterised protein [Serratia marcescens]SCY71145.1 hypothetical protein SAMN02927935_02228 [Serratia nematodiphila]
MMTLALYKRPLIILTLFLASALGVYLLAPEQRYAQWQWTQGDQALPTIAHYDLIDSYPAQGGTLLITSKRRASADYVNQVLFAGPKGVQMLGELNDLIYGTVCGGQECVLFLFEGRRLIDVQRGTIGALIPWPEGDDNRPSFVGGKLVAQPGKRALYLISTEGVFYSPDFGAHWRQTLDLPALLDARQLLGFERGEEDSPTAYASGKRKSVPEIFTAVDGDRVHFWMNPVLGSGALHIAVNGKTGEVIELHWLLVRVEESAQAPDGGIYLIAQTLDRGLYQLLRYQSDGQLKVLLETGDKSLYQLWAGNDKLVAQTDNGDARLSLIFDLRSSEVRYRQPLEYRYNGRDDARQTVIEPESHYGDDGETPALPYFIRYRSTTP